MPELKTALISLQVSSEEKKRIEDLPHPSEATDDSSHIMLYGIIFNAIKIQRLPELSFTRGLADFLEDFLGDDFVVTRGTMVLGKTYNFCEYATSLPDSTWFHKKKYICDNYLIDCHKLMTMNK